MTSLWQTEYNFNKGVSIAGVLDNTVQAW